MNYRKSGNLNLRPLRADCRRSYFLQRELIKNLNTTQLFIILENRDKFLYCQNQ